MLPQLEQLRDMAQDGRKLMLPLVDREIPLIADVWAKPELGSGCVKITPAHDPNDYEVGLRADLPMINILNPDGTINAEGGQYQGLTIPQARKKVVADLDELGRLGEVEDREIELPHSDRSKTPIEPYLADQWFVAMGDLAQSAMDAVEDDRVKIFPERYRKGYLDIPLRGKEDGAANYTVKIYLGSLQQKSIKPVATGPFDLSLQGDVVAKAISFEPSQGTGTNRVLVKEFNGVPVETSLKIDLTHLDAENPGSIAAIELIQE